MVSYKTLTLILFLEVLSSDGSKILGIFPFISKSHYTLGNVLLKELSRIGHEVTMISPFEEKNPPLNSYYRNIRLDFNLSVEDQNIDFFAKSMKNPYLATLFLNYAGCECLTQTLLMPNVRKLLASDETFDVVIMDQFVNDGFSYFAHRFNAKKILLSTVGASAWTLPLVGNPALPSNVAELHLPYTNEMTFWQRLDNAAFHVFASLNRHLYFFPRQDKIVREIIPDAPSLYDHLYNISLVLLNSHESFSGTLALVPAMKQVGGYHISPPEKLPEDIQQFLDGAAEGAVYFSLGSNLKSSELPALVRDAILRVFKGMKHRILWKWEGDVFESAPSNVKLFKWLPQVSVLAHPNVKAFITHCGLLSLTEAVYNGVPLLALPVYGDQYLNAANSVAKGFAISIPFHDFDETLFKTALVNLLTDPKYYENAQRGRILFFDRPRKPLDEAVYWVEYVLRQGGDHLKVATLKLSWYQYLLLDVGAFLILMLLLVVYVIRYSMGWCCKRRAKRKTD